MQVIAPASTIEDVKASLIRVALLSGRGVWARTSEQQRASRLVEDLESSGDDASTVPPVLSDGVWELILSDVEPFRASTFFLALGEAVEAKIQQGASDGALTVHSLATGGGEVGRVAHIVEADGTRLHSLVELRSGSLPSLPLALTGTVISSGELQSRGEAIFGLALKNTTVQQNRVKYCPQPHSTLAAPSRHPRSTLAARAHSQTPHGSRVHVSMRPPIPAQVRAAQRGWTTSRDGGSARRLDRRSARPEWRHLQSRIGSSWRGARDGAQAELRR